MPANKSERRAWENSLVVALRDWQWFRAKTLSIQFPEVFLPLSDAAENSTADAAVAIDRRFYLFELKAIRERISSEWNRGNGKLPKPVHRVVKSIAEDYELRGVNRDDRFISQSVVCHHFLYWRSTREGGVSALGHLLLEPYLLATLKARRATDNTSALRGASAILAQFELGLRMSKKPTTFDPTHRVSLENVNDDMARVAHWLPKDVEVVADLYKLGLPLEEFKKYLTDLLQRVGVGVLPINAIVMASDGSFFKHIRDTSQLSDVLRPSFPQRQDADLEDAMADLRRPRYPAVEMDKAHVVPGLLSALSARRASSGVGTGQPENAPNAHGIDPGRNG